MLYACAQPLFQQVCRDGVLYTVAAEGDEGMRVAADGAPARCGKEATRG
jgi:hypothetical protein